jgi:hypothetical protein
LAFLVGVGPQATMDFEARVHRVAEQLIPPNRDAGYTGDLSMRETSGVLPRRTKTKRASRKWLACKDFQ